jgi:hypothetical protein
MRAFAHHNKTLCFQGHTVRPTFRLMTFPAMNIRLVQRFPS